MRLGRRTGTERIEAGHLMRQDHGGRESRPALWRNVREPGPLAVYLTALAGAVVSPIILYWGHWTGHLGRKSLPFTSTGQFTLWIALLALESGIWALALVHLVAAVQSLWPERRSGRLWGSVVAVVMALVAVFVATVLGGNRMYPLPGHMIKVSVIEFLGYAVGLVGIVAMGLINSALRELQARQLHDPVAVTEAAERLVQLRADLQQLLLIEGIIVGAAVLATAGLRNAILAWAKTAHVHQSFPSSEVLVYGAAFSILLALFWGPISIRAGAVASCIRAAAMRQRNTAPFADWKAEYDAYGSYLGIDTDVVANARNVLAILTPVLSALLGILLKH
jgi:hypothetical protein